MDLPRRRALVRELLHRGCPRCAGRLMIEIETDEPEYVCLQCGFRRGLRLTMVQALRSERLDVA